MKSRTFPLGLLCAGLILSACAEEAKEGPSAEATAGATNVQNIPQLANCSPDAAGKLYLEISGTGLAVPQSEVRGVLTTNDNPAKPPNTSLFQRVPAGTGCPSQPVSTRDVRIETDAPHPSLSGLLTISPNRRDALEAFAKITRNLVQQRPEPACRQAGESLLDCRGEESLGGRSIKVLYLISTRPQDQTSFGGPITARCIIGQDSLQGCAVTDMLNGGVAFDMQLAALEPSVDTLVAAHAAATEKARSYLR